MPDQGWFPVNESKQIVRHLIVIIEITLALGIATFVFTYVVPEWKQVAEDVDGVVFVGLLIVLGIKLLRAFWRGNGFTSLATA